VTLRAELAELNSGWNLVSLNWKDGTGNRTIEVNSSGYGRNLIGFSGNESVNLSEVKFENGSGEWNWSEAVSLGKVQLYSVYFKNRYKYVGLSNTSYTDHKLRPNRGYWVYVVQRQL